VSLPDFFFALDLSDQSQAERMMNDVIASILRHAGYDAKASADIGGELRRALADGVTQGGHHCDVKFQAHDGTLSMSILFDRGSAWHAKRRLP
jgi:hypothetical protein